MVIVSCSGKFHAFNLAEQLQRQKLLQGFYTSYAYQKNSIFRKFAGREDKEEIDPALIHTNILLAGLIKKYPRPEKWNELFDKWVAARLLKEKKAGWFIGWSGMCLHSIIAARKMGMRVIVERGSSHIIYQDTLLKEEYSRFGKQFAVNPATIQKELEEYQLADFIAIPSSFVKRSFLEQGIPEKKLVMNPYGVSHFFTPVDSNDAGKKFKIVYVGTTSIRKGLRYLFEALDSLPLPLSAWEFHLVGHIDEDMQPIVQKYKKDNWRITGHVSHYNIPVYIAGAAVGIQPSLEEGLSMVILQLKACGIPVIASTNSGGEDVIDDGREGFIVPIRSPQAIRDGIMRLYNEPALLASMKKNLSAGTTRQNSWDAYGERYADFIKST